MKTLLSDEDINVAQRRFKDFQRDEELRHRQLARHMGQLDYNSNGTDKERDRIDRRGNPDVEEREPTVACLRQHVDDRAQTVIDRGYRIRRRRFGGRFGSGCGGGADGFRGLYGFGMCCR